MRDDDLQDQKGVSDDARSEWEADQLAALVGRQVGARRGDSPFDDARFLAWLSRDLRRRPHAAEDWSAEMVRAMRDRILVQAAARRLGVVAHQRACVERRPGIRAPLAAAVESAAREGCIPLIADSVAAGEGRALWDEECDRWIERPAELAAGQYLALPVSGDSMSPLMHAGDIVAVKLGPKVKRDTVVVARRDDDGYVVKRVGDIRPDALELTSLNPRYASLWIPREKNAVLGTVVFRWCPHRPR